MFGPQPFNNFTQGGILWDAARAACAWTATKPASWLGVHPYDSRAEGWRQCKGLSKRDPNAWPLVYGRAMEPLIREQVLTRLKEEKIMLEKFEETGLWISEICGLTYGASPDGLIDDDMVLEIKASIPPQNGQYKEPVDRIPNQDVVQIHYQMATTQRPETIYARYNGVDKISVLEADFSGDLFELFLKGTVEFYRTYVATGKEPPALRRGNPDHKKREELEAAIHKYNNDHVQQLFVLDWTHHQ